MAKKINYADMFTLRKDGRYQGSYRDESGKRVYLYDRDAEALYNKLQAAQEPKAVTFSQAAGEWERAHRERITERTWNNYAPHFETIVDEYGAREPSSIIGVEVERDLNRLKAQGLSATIVQTRRSLWSMILDYCVVQGYCMYNPVHSVKLPKGLKRGTRRAPTDDEIKIILTNIDKSFGLFPFFLLCTGLRKSEALSLTWEDVDFENSEIHITKSLEYVDGANPRIKSPKTACGVRIVPLISILKAELLKRPHASAYLFPSEPSNRGGKGGGIMTERGYEGAWKRYCKTVGFIDDDGEPTLTAHNLRHGTATLMFENKVDVKTAQKILGHAKLETTQAIYTELREKQKGKSIKKFDAGMSKLMSKSVS